jgi:hypothetical protein
MRFNKLVLFVCICFLANIASAQKTWEKPLQKWSKDDALRILSESPWAQSYQSAAAAVLAEQSQTARDQADQRILMRPEISRTSRQLGAQPVVVRLQSGLPIRQALVRLQQIEANYDKMNEEQRAKFDVRTKEFLDCPVCQNYYVVTLTKFRKTSTEGVDDAMFQTLKLEDLKGNIHLVNEKGEKSELAHYIAGTRPGESAVLFFPKKDNKGNQLFSQQDELFKIAFSNIFLQNRTNPYSYLLPRSFDFKVSKMMINNALNF